MLERILIRTSQKCFLIAFKSAFYSEQNMEPTQLAYRIHFKPNVKSYKLLFN